MLISPLDRSAGAADPYAYNATTWRHQALICKPRPKGHNVQSAKCDVNNMTLSTSILSFNFLVSSSPNSLQLDSPSAL